MEIVLQEGIGQIGSYSGLFTIDYISLLTTLEV